MFVDGGTKSPDVVFFIYKLKEILRKKGFNIDDYLIIYDNCRAHFLGEATDLEKYFHVLRLPPYSPQLNPIELFFGFIKSKIKFKFFKTKSRLMKFLDSLLKENHSILNSQMWKHCYKYYIESLFKNKFLN